MPPRSFLSFRASDLLVEKQCGRELFVTTKNDAARIIFFLTSSFCPSTAPLHTPPQLDHELLMPIQLLSRLAFVCLPGWGSHPLPSQHRIHGLHHSSSTTSHPSLHTKSQPNDLLTFSHARPNHLLRRLLPAAGCPGLCHALGPCDSFPRRHC